MSMNRRDLLLGATALGATSLLPAGAEATLPQRIFGTCPTPSPGGAEGPFYIAGATRRDITEGLPGFPLQVFLRIVDRNTCLPIEGVAVDIWHSDIPGAYSGFASEGTLGETFLRGIQLTDARGIASFQTIYPGWYPVRTPHIHVKVIAPGGAELLTTQVYFDDAVSRWVYRNVPEYAARGVHAVTNATDGGYRSDMELVLQPAGNGGYGGLTLTV
jgi:protocatechuate 3,4-dioxygenase beta subunit